MDAAFLGMPGLDAWTAAGLAAASFCTTFAGVTVGAAGGLALLTIMALVFPPAALIPIHTAVQLGAGMSRVVLMWRWVMRGTVPPFLAGAGLGAAAGAQIFVTLPTAALQGFLGLFVLVTMWLPRIGRVGAMRGRFAAAFLGMFVSATGTLLTPFVAESSPDRRNYVATFSALISLLHVVKLVAFGALGVALAAYLPRIAAMIATAAAGNWLGGRVLDRVPERAFRLVLKGVVSALALRLLWVAVRDLGLA